MELLSASCNYWLTWCIWPTWTFLASRSFRIDQGHKDWDYKIFMLQALSLQCRHIHCRFAEMKQRSFRRMWCSNMQVFFYTCHVLDVHHRGFWLDTMLMLFSLIEKLFHDWNIAMKRFIVLYSHNWIQCHTYTMCNTSVRGKFEKNIWVSVECFYSSEQILVW